MPWIGQYKKVMGRNYHCNYCHVCFLHSHTKTNQSSDYYFFNNIKSSSDTLTWSWALIHDVRLKVAFCLGVIASINSRCKESNNNERCDPQKLHTRHVNSSRLQGHMLVWNRHQVIEFMCTLGRYSRYMHTNTLINKHKSKRNEFSLWPFSKCHRNKFSRGKKVHWKTSHRLWQDKLMGDVQWGIVDSFICKNQTVSFTGNIILPQKYQ